MAAWKKIIVSGSDAELNSLNVTGAVTASGFKGDGSQLTGIATTLSISGSTSGTDTVNLKTDGLLFSASNNVTATVTDNTVTIGVSGLVSQSAQIDVRNTTGIATIATTGSNSFTGTQTISGNIFLSGANRLVYNNADDTSLLFGFYDGSTIRGPYYQIFGNNYSVASQRGSAEFVYDTRNGGDGNFHVASYDGSTWIQRFRTDNGGIQVTGSVQVTTSVTASAFKGDGSQVTNVTAAAVEYANVLNKPTLVSASSQVDVRNTTGIATIATTGSNSFTGVQTVSNTTNSTVFNNGALVVQGGVGIAKDVNISGSLTVQGLLTAVSTSIQYVTSSQLNVSDNKITVQSNDIVRFGGLSIYDSGSTSATASIYWDSLNHKFIYENLGGSDYNSAILIGGPKNTGALGNETGLITGRVPVATGDDHIDTNLVSSSIRIDFSNRLTHIEAGLYVTGGISASGDITAVNFRGSGQYLTGIAADSVQYANVLNKPALVSASSQIDHNATTNYVANQHVDHSSVSISAGSGLTGGGDITTSRTISLDTSSATFLNGVKSKLNTETVVSSSSQITAVLTAQNVHSASYLGTATTSNLPEGSNLYYLDSRVKDKLNTEGVVSSSAQIVAGVAGQTIAPTTVNATTINASGNVVITGDLTVNGDTTTINTTNVLVEDRYLLLNSGSVLGAPAQGGIVVQDGSNASGSAMLYSTLNSKNRWGVAENVAANAATAVQTAYVATVTDMNIAAQSAAVTTYEKPGNIKVETNGDIYIWA